MHMYNYFYPFLHILQELPRSHDTYINDEIDNISIPRFVSEYTSFEGKMYMYNESNDEGRRPELLIIRYHAFM